MNSSLAGPLSDALAVETGAISDAAFRLSFRKILAAAATVGAGFDQAGIATSDCVAFHCDNCVPSAVVLLALLLRGQSFVLLRGPEASATRGDQATSRQTFCRYRLQVREPDVAACTADTMQIPILDRSLVISENDSWDPAIPAGPAFVFLPTSGSTGRAKLVRHKQEFMLPAARNCAERLGLTPDDRVAIPVPIAHMYGLGAAFLPSLLTGARIDLQSGTNALRYFARERQFDPTVVFLTPGAGDSLVRVRKTSRTYRLTVMAGDRLTPDVFDRYEQSCGPLVNLYGSTELGATAVGRPTDPRELRRAFVGPLLPGVSARPAVAPDPGDERPDGAGPLQFRHAFGFDGYIDVCGHAIAEPDGTLASGDCFRSSDVGRLVGGYLELYGRGDDLVKRDGLLVACADVADAIRRIEGIREVAVLTGDEARRGRALTAFCVAEAAGQWNPATLRQACFDVLPTRAVPDEIRLIAEMPLLPSGKIDRQELRRRQILSER
jgi:acyl-coenzyme A synthetase/AMP-(fatty) acid ligase